MKIGWAIILAFILLTPIGGAILCGIVWLAKGAPKKRTYARPIETN